MGNEQSDDVLVKHYQNRYNKLKDEYSELQAQAQRMADALEFVKANGLCSETTEMINASLQQFKDGREVGNGQ